MPALRVVPIIFKKLFVSSEGQGQRAVGDRAVSGPDGVSGSETDPLRDRAVLLLGFGKLLLGTEGFVALQKRYQSVKRKFKILRGAASYRHG